MFKYIQKHRVHVYVRAEAGVEAARTGGFVSKKANRHTIHYITQNRELTINSFRADRCYLPGYLPGGYALTFSLPFQAFFMLFVLAWWPTYKYVYCIPGIWYSYNTIRGTNACCVSPLVGSLRHPSAFQVGHNNPEGEPCILCMYTRMCVLTHCCIKLFLTSSTLRT